MAVAVDPVSDLQARLEQTAADPSLDPADKLIKLRDLRGRIADLLGAADSTIGIVNRLSESEASQQARLVLWARSNADLRESLMAASEITAVDADEAGLLSHAELDRLAEEGLLAEAVVGIAKAWDKSKHARGRGGKFSDMFNRPSPPAAARGAAVGHPGAAPGPIDTRHERYFKHDPDASIIHVSRLKPTRNDTPEHIQKARDNLDKASQGLMEKRKPLTGVENGDGTVSITDGNSTLAALQAEGLTHFPVKLEDTHGKTAEEVAVGRAADELAGAASKAEPAVTAALQRVTADNGGELSGLEHRLKTQESLQDKIRRKQAKYPGMAANEAAGRITDALRYTAVFPDENYADGIEKTIASLDAAGFKVWMAENYWGGRDDYDGFHANLRGPNGENVELQIHTPESLAMKTKQHPLYEKYRSSVDDHERWLLWQAMVANAASVPQPPGLQQQASSAKTHPAPPEA